MGPGGWLVVRSSERGTATASRANQCGPSVSATHTNVKSSSARADLRTLALGAHQT